MRLNLVTTLKLTAMSQEAYQNETYTATIAVTYKNGTGAETWWNEGVLTVYLKRK